MAGARFPVHKIDNLVHSATFCRFLSINSACACVNWPREVYFKRSVGHPCQQIKTLGLYHAITGMLDTVCRFVDWHYPCYH